MRTWDQQQQRGRSSLQEILSSGQRLIFTRCTVSNGLVGSLHWAKVDGLWVREASGGEGDEEGGEGEWGEAGRSN